MIQQLFSHAFPLTVIFVYVYIFHTETHNIIRLVSLFFLNPPIKMELSHLRIIHQGNNEYLGNPTRSPFCPLNHTSCPPQSAAPWPLTAVTIPVL